MGEVTGVVISHLVAQGRRKAGGGTWIPAIELRGSEPLAQIFHPCAEFPSSLRPAEVVAEQLAVLFKRGAAAGRIDDDGVEVKRLENFEVAPGAIPGAFEVATVGVESAAADLPFWGD